MNLFNINFSEFTVEEWVIFYGGVIVLLGFVYLGVSILVWRDRYR